MIKISFNQQQFKELNETLQQARFNRPTIVEKNQEEKLKRWLLAFVKYLSIEQKQRDKTLLKLKQFLQKEQCLQRDQQNGLMYKQSVERLAAKIAKQRQCQLQPGVKDKTPSGKSDEISTALLTIIHQIIFEEVNQHSAKDLKNYVRTTQALKEYKDNIMLFIQKIQQWTRASQLLESKDNLGIMDLSNYIKACSHGASDRDIEEQFAKLTQQAKHLFKPLNEEILRLRQIVTDYSLNVFRDKKFIGVAKVINQDEVMRRHRQKTVDHLLDESNKLHKQCQAWSSLVGCLAKMCKEPNNMSSVRQQINRAIISLTKQSQRNDLKDICQYLEKVKVSKKEYDSSPRKQTGTLQSKNYMVELQKEKESKSKELQKLSDYYQQDISLLKKQIQQLKQKIKSQEKTIDALRKDNEKKITESPLKTPQTNRQPEQYKVTSAKETQLPVINQSFSEQLHAIQKDNDRLLSQNNKLKQKLATYSIQKIQNASITKETLIRSYEQNENKLQSSIKILAQSNQALQNQLTSIKGQLSQLREKGRKYDEMSFKAQERQIQQTYSAAKQTYQQNITELQQKSYGRLSSGSMSSKRSLQTDEIFQGSPIKLVIRD